MNKEKREQLITEASFVQYPEFKEEFTISVHHSKVETTASLSQGITVQARLRVFSSSDLNKAESNYGTSGQELLTTVFFFSKD